MRYTWVSADYSQAEARVVAWAGPIPAMKTWFLNGEDIHLNVARLIGRVAQTAKLKLPKDLFSRKPWEELTSEDEERQLAKNTVHGNNYNLGKVKFGLMTGLPVREASLVQDIYHGLVPEIKQGYHVWINTELRRTSTLYNPLGARRIFYDPDSTERSQTAYAWYAQSTIGLLLVNTLIECCEIFAQELPEATVITPQAIRTMGLDVRMQVHDNVNVICPDSEDAIEFTCQTIKRVGEIPLMIKGDPLIVPLDFKVGPDLSKKSLVKRKVI